MTPGDRRTIEEVAELYELEPRRQDIYVEGPTDAYFLRWFLGQANNSNARVYEISTVEVPVDMIKKYNLNDNNRDRVIVLAFMLASRLGEESVQATCIADRDFDLVLHQQHICGLLLFTDYTCIEMYLFDEKCMDKFLNICIRRSIHSPACILGQFSLTLQELFLIRLANKILGLGLEWMTFERCCRLRDGEVVFDAKDFINRYLNKNGKQSKQKEFLAAVDSCRSKLSGNPRYQMNGHDYIDLLSWYLAKHRVDKKLCASEIIERNLFACVEYEQLSNESLFKQLLARPGG
jgi:hypothetical protein